MKKVFSLILCAVLVFSLATISFADAPDDSHDDLIMPHGPCSQCGSFGLDYFCQEKVAKTDTGTHTYAFGTKQCTVTYYYCYSDWMCWNCKYMARPNIGPHLCAEVHSSCSKGVYHVCTVGGWLPIS